MKTETKKTVVPMILLALYAVLQFMLNVQTTVGTYVTTMYAFSYKYGFISRGFQGTVLLFLDKILPWNFVSYQGVLVLCYLQILAYDVLVLLFIYICLKKSEISLHHGMWFCIFIFTTFAFPEYVAFQNFGRADAWTAGICIVGMLLLLTEKAEWMIVLLSAVGVCIHQGFVLMFMAPMLVILLVKGVDAMETQPDGKKRLTERTKKYWAILFWSAVVAVVLFLYFTYFSHYSSSGVYDEIYALADSMGYEGYEVKVHAQLIMNEILGQSPASDEWSMHIYNFKEGLIFFILTLPYTILLVVFFRNCIKQANGVWEKLKYIAIALGAATILPDLIAKIDYGRWVYSIISYYFLVVMVLLAINDRIIIETFHTMAKKMKRYKVGVVLLCLYPLCMVPMGDTWITPISKMIADWFVAKGF